MDKIRVARIDVVATVWGRDELQWSDVTIRRPTAVATVEGAARLGRFAATQGEKENMKNIWEQKRNWLRHCETDQLRTEWKTKPTDDKHSPRGDDEVG